MAKGEKLQVSYRSGSELITLPAVDRPHKRFRKEHASKADGKIIADAMLSIVPGTRFSSTGVFVDRIHTTDNGEIKEHLFGWDHPAKKAMKRQVRKLGHDQGFGFVGPELAPFWGVARKKGKKAALRDWNQIGEDKGFTLGKWRGRLYTRMPLLHELHVPFGEWVTRMSNGKLPVSELGLGLGPADRDLTHELRPGRTIAELTNFISGILRRAQDRELDAADIVHGVGKDIVNIIEANQKGWRGMILSGAEAEFPFLRRAVEGIVTVEALTSADRHRSQGALLMYDAIQSRALERRIEKAAKRKEKRAVKAATQAWEKANPGQKATKEQIEAEEQKQRQQTAAKTPIERLIEHGKENFARRLRNGVHNLLWQTTNVQATELDRGSQIQDRVDMQFILEMINDPYADQRPLAHQRFRKDLAIAFTLAMNQARTFEQKELRKLSGESETLEAEAEQLLRKTLPSKMVDLVMGGLKELKASRDNMPEAYKADLKSLKTHEENDSYADYAKALRPLAEKYSRPITETGLSEQQRVLWEQSLNYLNFQDSILKAAASTVTTLRRDIPQAA